MDQGCTKGKSLVAKRQRKKIGEWVWTFCGLTEAVLFLDKAAANTRYPLKKHLLL